MSLTAGVVPVESANDSTRRFIKSLGPAERDILVGILSKMDSPVMI